MLLQQIMLYNTGSSRDDYDENEYMFTHSPSRPIHT
jgi:hypothetical protein